MVRTYAVNALTQSSENIFNNNTSNPRRGTWEQPQERQRELDRPQYNRFQPVSPPEMSNDPGPHQYQSSGKQADLPPLGLQSRPSHVRDYNMPNFVHSPYVDPVGSIVGLRVVYSEGKVAFVPVEPHINYLINQQFASQITTPPVSSIYQTPSNYNIQAQNVNPAPLPSFLQQPVQSNCFQEEPIYNGPQQQKHCQEYNQPYQPQQQQQQPVHQRREGYQNMGNLPNRVETPQSLPPNLAPTHNVRRRSDEMNDYWFPNNPQPRSGVRRSKEWKNEAVDVNSYNPSPSPYNPSPSYGDYSSSRMPSFAPMSVSSSLPNLNKGGMSDADQHRAELARQIEDNRRRKEIEKQKEREQEEREIRKNEEYMAKIRREEEEERRKQKEKAMVTERRAQQIAYEQQERSRQQARQGRSPPPQHQQQHEYAQRPSRPNSGAPRESEWWEKKPTWQQKQDEERKSAVIPTLRGKPPRTPSAQRSVSRHSMQRYDPTTSIQEHEVEQREQREREESARSRRSLPRRQHSSNDLNESFRRMDITEENLRAEHERVHSAIRDNDYGNNVFNDAHGRPTAFVIH